MGQHSVAVLMRTESRASCLSLLEEATVLPFAVSFQISTQVKGVGVKGTKNTSQWSLCRFVINGSEHLIETKGTRMTQPKDP